jgi:NAD(P)-dependent dehydrogenase (short-subunit alcohol dehydrogenase family)
MKVVVITGVTRGLGRALAEKFVEQRPSGANTSYRARHGRHTCGETFDAFAIFACRSWDPHSTASRDRRQKMLPRH